MAGAVLAGCQMEGAIREGRVPEDEILATLQGSVRQDR